MSRRRRGRPARPACARCGYSPRRTRVHLMVAAGDAQSLRWLCCYSAHCRDRRRHAEAVSHA